MLPTQVVTNGCPVPHHKGRMVFSPFPFTHVPEKSGQVRIEPGSICSLGCQPSHQTNGGIFFFLIYLYDSNAD